MAVQINGNIFEGLFQRVLRPTGAFADELRLAGYDATQPRHSYPLAVWDACLAVAARRVCPGQALPEAHHHLGRCIAAGYQQTLVGRVLLAMVPHLSPETILNRLPTWLSSGVAPGITLDVVARGPRRWVLRVRHTPDAIEMPDFTAGAFEGLFAGVPSLRVEVAEPVPSGYTLVVTW
jgi:uncharacterized protein (TIGR02265 family)